MLSLCIKLKVQALRLSLRSAIAAAAAFVPAVVSSRAIAADDAAGVASSRMSYSRFLEYLDMGRVKKVCFVLVMFKQLVALDS